MKCSISVCNPGAMEAVGEVMGEPEATDGAFGEVGGVEDVESGALVWVIVHEAEEVAMVLCLRVGMGDEARFFGEAEGMAVPGFDFMGLRVQL